MSYNQSWRGAASVTTGPSGPSIPGLSLNGLDLNGQRSSQAAETQTPTAATVKPKKGRKSKYALRKEAILEKEALKEQVAPPGTRARPSEASGGVPNPTQQYLTQAFRAPSTLASARRILVVLDLNGTLIYRPSKKRPFDFVERPHARRFLAYCLDTFHLAIWSSARPINVQKMLQQLLDEDQRGRCVLTWARDQFGLDASDYNNRVQCYKRLTRLWADPAAMAAGHWDQTNTVLVDDSLEKARSEPFNLLEIPEFFGGQNEPTDVLPQVHDYLNALCYQSDISRFIRLNPFKLDPRYVLRPPPAAQ